MISLTKEFLQIKKEQDVILFRNRLREMSVRIGMSLVNQTKLITAASELVRNMLKFANGGKITMEVVSEGRKTGIRIVFEDKGPGIPDIKMAMQDGYSTAKSLGLGLPGAKRLVNEFEIKSVVNEGTTVTVIRWKNG
ncbi:MAG: anti-sigma regulatory factor [Bacteroidota bacterium]